MHHNFIDTKNFIGQGWRLFCPADSEESISISLEGLALIQRLGKVVQLVITRDDKRKRIYVSNLLAGPNGHQSCLQTGAENQSGLHYPSGWMAEVIPDDEVGSAYESCDPMAAAPLIEAFPDVALSDNFRLSDFRPGEHSYNYIRVSPSLVRLLEKIRAQAGTIEVLAGYQPMAYNQKVGGVSNSPHIDGLAARITTKNLSMEALHQICDEIVADRGGVGFFPYSESIQVDLRGYRARWGEGLTET